MKFKHRIYFAPDPGAPAGAEPVQEPSKEPDELAKTQSELKKAQEELEALKKAKAEEDKAKAEEAKAKMTAAEKAKAEKEELEKMKAETVRNYKLVSLQKAGVGEDYISLISGGTQEEINAQGELLAKLIADVRTETEAAVKKTVAKTGAPGAGAVNEEVSAEDFYKGLSRRS